jgi:hypothetical protein
MSDPFCRAALLYQLFALYRKEGLVVSYTMEDFQRDFIKEHLPDATPQEQEDLFRAWPAAWRLFQNLPLEMRLGRLPPEARLVGLTLEQLEDMRQFLDTAIAGLRARRASQAGTGNGRRSRGTPAARKRPSKSPAEPGAAAESF